jgi:hypothetical protein
VLPFGCSCLVSSSPSKVGQFSFGGLWFKRSVLQSTTCPALAVVFAVCLLGFPQWGFISLPCPLFLGQVQCSISPLCCLCFVTACCLFFSFVGQFSFGCCLLAQDMSSVIHFLPCFGDCLLPALSWPSCLYCVCLLIVWC